MTAASTPTTPAMSGAGRIPMLAVLGFAVSAVLTALGTFWDFNDNDKSEDHSFGDYAIVLGIAAVAAVIVFGLVVRTAADGVPGRRSAILGVVAVVSIVVFWAGLPAVLAAGAIATALLDRDKTGRFGNASKAGLALAGLALVAAVVLAFIG